MSEFPTISTDQALVDLVDKHTHAEVLALDTEFVRERTYFPELCLVQLRSDRHAACIDTIALKDLSPLAEMLSRAGVINILHSCRQDLEALNTRFPVQLSTLYDTQLAAAFCGHGDQVSYAAMVEKVCDKVLPKSHTRTDWSKRPLSHGQLEYAMDDVNFLRPVYDHLNQTLEKMGRAAWHEIECQSILDDGEYRVDDQMISQVWRKLKGAARLPLDAQPCARSLSLWREKIAINRDRPREWILPSAVILQISQQKPDSKSALSKIDGLSSGTVSKLGRQILDIVDKTASEKIEQPIWFEVEILTPDQRKLVKSLMKKLSAISADFSISQSLLANRNEVEKLVRGRRDLKMLSGWRQGVFGDQLLKMIS